jgi:hypothetical protein
MVYGFGECNEHDRSRLSLRKSGREGIRHWWLGRFGS